MHSLLNLYTLFSSQRVQLHVASPRKTVSGDSPSPSKPKAMVQDALQKLPFTAKYAMSCTIAITLC